MSQASGGKTTSGGLGTEIPISAHMQDLLLTLATTTANGSTSRGGAFLALTVGIGILLYSFLDLYNSYLLYRAIPISIEIFSLIFSGVFFIVLALLSLSSPRRSQHG